MNGKIFSEALELTWLITISHLTPVHTTSRATASHLLVGVLTTLLGVLDDETVSNSSV